MKLFSFLFILTLFLSPVSVKALPFTNFGGQIVGVFPCPFSANWILFIRDARFQFLPLVFQPGFTFLYKMYQPRPAVNALGSFIPGGTCSGFPVAGTILQIGTSLIIGVPGVTP